MNSFKSFFRKNWQASLRFQINLNCLASCKSPFDPQGPSNSPSFWVSSLQTLHGPMICEINLWVFLMLPLNSFVDGKVEMTVGPQDWVIKILKLKTYRRQNVGEKCLESFSPLWMRKFWPWNVLEVCCKILNRNVLVMLWYCINILKTFCPS